MLCAECRAQLEDVLLQDLAGVAGGRLPQIIDEALGRHELRPADGEEGEQLTLLRRARRLGPPDGPRRARAPARPAASSSARSPPWARYDQSEPAKLRISAKLSAARRIVDVREVPCRLDESCNPGGRAATGAQRPAVHRPAERRVSVDAARHESGGVALVSQRTGRPARSRGSIRRTQRRPRRSPPSSRWSPALSRPSRPGLSSALDLAEERASEDPPALVRQALAMFVTHHKPARRPRQAALVIARPEAFRPSRRDDRRCGRRPCQAARPRWQGEDARLDDRSPARLLAGGRAGQRAPRALARGVPVLRTVPR